MQNRGKFIFSLCVISLKCNFSLRKRFLAAALAVCSSSQYHVVVPVVVVVVPELLSEFEIFGFLKVL